MKNHYLMLDIYIYIYMLGFLSDLLSVAAVRILVFIDLNIRYTVS